MKLLLTAINAKYIHSNLAVYSLKAFADKYANGQDIEIAEFTINHSADDILSRIYKKQPNVLFFSCYIWNLKMIEELLPELEKILPQTEIWLGGPEVSYDATDFLKEHPQVRGILCGEGEETFCELTEYYYGKRMLEETGGIVWRENAEKICQTFPRRLLDMDKIPFVYETLERFENRIIYYESSRGCPFSCSYCLSSIDKRVRFRSTELVKRELQFFLDHRVPQVKFVDRTFNCRHSHALEIWKYIRAHDNGVTNFHFEIAADLLNEEELQILSQMRPGLVQLEIGVQSTNSDTIREIDRVTDFTRLCEIVRYLQQGENIHLHLDLIAGLPQEDYESFVRSFNDVYRLHPEQLQLGFLKVLKGSKMQKKAEDYGLCFRQKPMYEVLFTKWISYEELLKLKAVEEMVEMYYNSNQFTNTVRQLETEFNHPFALYEALAAFHEEKGYTEQKMARSARITVLREFIQSVSITDLEKYDSLLLLDLYLRENSKSRPVWAADLSVHKKELLDFYEKEENIRRFLPDYEGRSAKQLLHMTHLEPFLLNGKTVWLLFDYQKRSPLTKDALTRDVSEVF
ncbi:MAG: B12-binding domain-containing radical SAM protein [Marvinbryantia sp.]|jgi:radical SAM superfamily enzyme YgiQ (UPF0313 family)